MAQQDGDQEMTDAAAGAEAHGAANGDFVREKQRLRLVLNLNRWGCDLSLTPVQLPGSTETAASFAFEKEDHTLGNALRYMIMKK